jgi:DNA-nicking Smr family endonuclease
MSLPTIKSFKALHSLCNKVKIKENDSATSVQSSLETTIFRGNTRDVVPLVPSKFSRSINFSMPIIRKYVDSAADNPVGLTLKNFDAKIATKKEKLEHDFTKNGVSTDVIRKLKRGYWKTHTIDLHGLKYGEAQGELTGFMHIARSHNWRCICIIHGKGIRSLNREPVLRPMVYNWLLQDKEVLAFCHPSDTKGGSGALLVLLKRQKL